MVRYLTARSEQNSVGDNMQLNALQQSNAAKLGNMGYRFNRIEQVGSSIVLKQEVTLLTGKRFELNVATLDASGCVEMHDDVAI